MPNVITTEPTVERTVVAPPLRSQMEVAPHRVGSNTRWGAIIAGVFLSASLWLVLHLLGMGIGLTAIDPQEPNSLRGVGIGTGIWSVIAPIIALFIGGFVTSRLAPSPSKLNRAIHGGLVWAVSTLAVVVLLYAITANLVRGVVSTGGQVVSSVGSAVGGAVSQSMGQLDQGTLQSLGIDSEELLGPINQRLRAEGKPEVTAAQLEAVAKDAIGTAVRTGSVDREILVQSLAQNTKLSRQDAEELATTLQADLQRRTQGLSQRGSELAESAQTMGLQAAEATGKALTALSIALLLGLAAAVGGALLTGRHDRRRVITTDDTVRTTVT